MKKIFLSLILVMVLLLTGCGSVSKEKLRDDFINDIKDLKSYYMTGELSVNNNDDTYTYDVSVSYSSPDNFKVVLLNKANNYEQIILRNTTGVYVINTSLNKSFKFQSEWPYNNSQSYLLQSLITDLKNDENYEFTEKDGNYVFKVDVCYPNNKELVKENIHLDKNANLKYVEVLDANDIPRITFKVIEIDKKANFKDNYFEIDEKKELEDNEDKTNINDSSETETNTTGKIEDALFPLYLPANTVLSNKEVIETTSGERVIMTFSGDSSFILVQENVSKEEEFTIIPSYGEPYLLIDTVGALTDTSYTWISSGIEYYIVSDVLSTNELLEVAKSINVVATLGEK
ncbi:MAG: hypothetical protein PUC23_01200 [bacterium]|nr:hypothetical protein [bacterium]